MGKWWSLLFGVTMLACAALSFAAPVVGWWLPEGVSTHAGEVDFLFYVILGVTAFFFLLTEFLLCYFMFIYAGRDRPVQTNRADLPLFMRVMTGFTTLIPKFLHDQHRVEMAWTIVPAVILLFIAFAQVDSWAKMKYQSRSPNHAGAETPLQVAVSARQFEWRMRYPSPERFRQWLAARGDKTILKDIDSFARVPQADDVHVVNELHAWKGHPCVAQVTTRDVIHSFNLPNFRVKQDALPGRSIPAWFTATKANVGRSGSRWVDGVNPATGQPDPAFTWDIPCAELCGWGHFRMIGRVYIHDTQDDFLAWLDHAAAENNAGKTNDAKEVAAR